MSFANQDFLIAPRDTREIAAMVSNLLRQIGTILSPSITGDMKQGRHQLYTNSSASLT